MSMGLAIVGYGKMGRLIQQFAPEYGFEVRAKFDASNNAHGQALSHQTLRGVDAAVEFTSPGAAPENIRRLAVLGINSVVGTTGWLEDLPSVRDTVAKSGTGLVWAPNFSVGMNLFLQAVAHTAALFAKQPARIRARMKLVLIAPRTASRCATPRATAKASRVERSERRAGSWVKRGCTNFARFSAN